MFKLLRYFSIASLLAFIVVIALLGLFYRQIAINDLIELEESKNVALTQAFANSLGPEFAPYVASTIELTEVQLLNYIEITKLSKAVQAQMDDLSVIRVKVYNRNGTAIFSTDESQIGDNDGDSEDFHAVLRGEVISELTPRGTLRENVIEERDVLSTYMPLRADDQTDDVVGVFELYSDVTPLLQRIEETQRTIVLGAAFILLALYAVLFFIVRHADKIIHHQYRERKQAEEILQQHRMRLEERTIELNATNRRLEREIIERSHAEKNLYRMQKQESLGAMAGGIAHDFNNLLVALLGQTSLALAKLAPDHASRLHIEKAVKAAERAANLTKQLLAYTGRGHFELHAMDLNILIQESVHLFSVAVPKNVTLSTNLADALPLINADASQLQQVIMNLLLNGAESISMTSGPQAGVVTMVTGTQDVSVEDEYLWHYTGEPLTPGRYVTLEVHDNGQGMKPERLARIFDPFFTTKKAGHGLGLAAVLGIIRGHKGGVYVYSEEGKGTIFKLVFPVSTATQSISAPPRLLETTVDQNDLILVIDDEADVRETAADLLAQRGFQVLTASDGTSGIDLYQDKQADICLVLLDLSMPGLTGEQTFHKLRTINPDVRVLLSSGYSEVDANRHFADQGILGFLQKPYTLDGLTQAIQHYLS